MRPYLQTPLGGNLAPVQNQQVRWNAPQHLNGYPNAQMILVFCTINLIFYCIGFLSSTLFEMHIGLSGDIGETSELLRV